LKDFPILETSYIYTREQFHLIAKLIGKVRETLVKPIAKNDNLWLSVVDKGFCTPPITEFSELEIGCNIETSKIEIANSKDFKAIDIKGKPIAEIGNDLVSILKEHIITIDIDLSKISSLQVFNVMENDSNNFLTQFSNYHWLLKEFHSRIRDGVKTQICLWPHHFDNGFIWYCGKKINEQDEQTCLTADAIGRQVGIGVSNGDETYSLPYIYMTFWPELRRTNKLEIVDGAILHSEGWTGIILPYHSVEEKKNINEQKKLVEDFFNISFETVKKEFGKR